MSSSNSSFCQDVRSRLQRLNLPIEEKSIQRAIQFRVRQGAFWGMLTVYNTNAIVVDCKQHPELKERLEQIKAEAERGDPLPQHFLPGEVEQWPEKLCAEVPDLDEIILRYFTESVACLRAEILMASSFMLGAASERAIELLIESFGRSITDEVKKLAFVTKMNNKRSIKTMFDEFKVEYKKIKNSPDDPELSNVIEVIEAAFHNLRLTRNEIGHPQFIPDLDRSGVLSQLDYFRKHIRRILKLQAYFIHHGVVLG